VSIGRKLLFLITGLWPRIKRITVIRIHGLEVLTEMKRNILSRLLELNLAKHLSSLHVESKT